MSAAEMIVRAYHHVEELELEPMLTVWAERLVEEIGHEDRLQAIVLDTVDRCLIVHWYRDPAQVTAYIEQDASVEVVTTDYLGLHDSLRADDVEALLEQHSEALRGVLEGKTLRNGA